MSLPEAITVLGFLVVVIVQTATFAFFVGALSQRVTGNTARIQALEDGGTRSDEHQSDLLVRFGRLEERMALELEHIKAAQATESRQLEGLARQISALAGQRRGAKPPMADAYSPES